MGGIQFNEDRNFNAQFQTKRSDWVDWMVAKGFAKSRSQGIYILIGIAVVAVLIAWIFLPGGGTGAIEDPGDPITGTTAF